MTTVADILNFIETIAPPYMKESWDRVGLNCGHLDRQVDCVLVALDPSTEACREAVYLGAQLLVTHHHLIWEPGFITDQDQQGMKTLYLIEKGVAHINAHTNLDLAPGGVNDALAATLGMKNVEILNPIGTDTEGRPYGLIRVGEVEQQSLAKFLYFVKNRLQCEGLRYTQGRKKVQKVAVGGGACGSELGAVIAAGCDTFITGDLKYNHFQDAHDAGLNLIDAGHFNTENPVVSVLAKKIAARFPEVLVQISEKHHNCVKFY